MHKVLGVAFAVLLQFPAAAEEGKSFCVYNVDPDYYDAAIGFVYRSCIDGNCDSWKQAKIDKSPSREQISNFKYTIHWKNDYIEKNRHLRTAEFFFEVKFDHSFESGLQEKVYKLQAPFVRDPADIDICGRLDRTYHFIKLGNGLDIRKGCPAKLARPCS